MDLETVDVTNKKTVIITKKSDSDNQAIIDWFDRGVVHIIQD